MTRAIVVGCSSFVWSDVKAAQELCTFDKVYCVKLAAVHWPGRFDTAITLHPEWSEKYKSMRRENGYPMDFETVAPLVCEMGEHGKHEVDRRVSYRWPGMNASASSGIYGAKVALEDGHSRVVLAGIPMDVSAGHFTRGQPWKQRDSFMVGFDHAVPKMMGKVRSMSGLTAERLGVPTREWLNAD